MDRLVVIYILCCAICALGRGQAFKLEKLGSFPLNNPGFTTLYPHQGASGQTTFDLVISAFSAIPFTKDLVYVIRDVGRRLKNVTALQPQAVVTDATWPNEASGVPEKVFNGSAVAVPQGFLVPFKTDGSIQIVALDTSGPSRPVKITGEETGKWFYHRVEWRDMDGDGDMDAVTCRAREPILGFGKDSEFVWFENNNQLQSPWRAHVITHGPDIFFNFATVNISRGSPQTLDVVFTAGFFSKKLSMFWTDDPQQRWTNTAMIKSRVIEDAIGDVFEVQVTDVNADGHVDLLVTNNGASGALFVYELPSGDIRTGSFVKHELASGFKPRTSGMGKGAPGAPQAVYPDTHNETGKPLILLSLDDGGQAVYLEPTSPAPSVWEYSMTSFLDVGQGTVGQLSSADVDGDGLCEVFAPSYNTNEMFVFRFAK